MALLFPKYWKWLISVHLILNFTLEWNYSSIICSDDFFEGGLFRLVNLVIFIVNILEHLSNVGWCPQRINVSFHWGCFFATISCRDAKKPFLCYQHYWWINFRSVVFFGWDLNFIKLILILRCYCVVFSASLPIFLK